MNTKGAIAPSILLVIVVVLVISIFTIFNKFSVNSPFGTFGQKTSPKDSSNQTKIAVQVAYVNPFNEINPQNQATKNPFSDNPVEDLVLADQK